MLRSGSIPLSWRATVWGSSPGAYKFYEAEEHYRQVIQELEQYYGESHFLLPHVLRNLGWLLRQPDATGPPPKAPGALKH